MESTDFLFFGTAVLYLIAQTASLRVMKGGWRIASLVPLAIFVLSAAILVLGVFIDASLAGVYLVMAVPFCFLCITVLWLVWFGVRFFK
jgi:hypothetical protein